MLIPSIDLQNGRIVQLVQGETLAVESSDIDEWIERFAEFPRVQLIDLDAAMSRGHNDDLVRRIATRRPCRVGGGVRSVGRAEELLAAGAEAVIAGSALFLGPAQWGGTTPADPSAVVNHDFARALADTVGPERVICAVDARGGRVVIHGWRTALPITPPQAVNQLEGYCDEFLYTIVDREGLMNGTDMEAIASLRQATARKVTAAGGITTREEVDALHAIEVDAVVGMAIYTGRLSLDDVR